MDKNARQLPHLGPMELCGRWDRKGTRAKDQGVCYGILSPSNIRSHIWKCYWYDYLNMSNVVSIFLQVPAQRYVFMKGSCPILGKNHKCPESHAPCQWLMTTGRWCNPDEQELGCSGESFLYMLREYRRAKSCVLTSKHCLQIMSSPAKTRKDGLLTGRPWHVSNQVLCTAVLPDEPWLWNFKIWDKNSSSLLSNSC